MASLSLTACGGGGGTTAPPPITYTVSGTVFDLSGAGLVLQNDGGNSTSVGTNGGFTFTAPVAKGGPYKVTVLTQPSGPSQNCTVINASGIATANITNVQVVCISEWTWVGGADLIDKKGSYGTQGAAAPGNTPGARWGSVTWTDTTGNFWLFGGYGFDSAGELGYLNDLWRFGAGEWTWISGSAVINQPATYGTQGTAAPGNVPSARFGSVSWMDGAGSFWFFGGEGIDSTGSLYGPHNDMWKFNAGEWTWMGGSNLLSQNGTYGTQGMAAPSNTPGARQSPVAWTDASGDFWLFGGMGADSIVADGTGGWLNDLWKYSSGEWTWTGGSNVVNQPGIYGVQGTAAPSNIPGARIGAVSWFDAAGDLWLFGGQGIDSTGTASFFCDLWRYSAGEWTWMGGSDVANQIGVYGVQGTSTPSNLPGARRNAVGWIDAHGTFWLLGGYGFDSTENFDRLNDLWKYSAGEWTWMGGSNIIDQAGVYGVQSTSSPSNVPGARENAFGWVDAHGNLWLLGGYGYDSAGNRDILNDLWEYKP